MRNLETSKWVINPSLGGVEAKGTDKRNRYQFTLKVNTIFEDSPIGLDKWMTAFWMLVNCKNGISSMELHRTLGITQKSAWFMLQRLRLALQDDFYGKKLGSGPNSEVEVDETFIGGKARNMQNRAKRNSLAA